MYSNRESLYDWATKNKPIILKQWHPTKNNGLTPKMFSKGSNTIVWWICDKCNYEWQLSIKQKTKLAGQGCPVCSNRKIIPGYNDFETYCRKNGLDYLIEEFDEEKNGFPMNSISKGSNKVLWFKCKNGHSFSSTICHRLRGDNCTYCSKHLYKFVPGYNDVKTYFNRYKCSYFLKGWDYARNKSKPEECFASNAIKYFWLCEKHHSFKQNVYKRRTSKKCPICSNQKLEKGFNDFETYCKKNNCMSVLDLWDFSNNTVKPCEIHPFSKLKRNWTCDKLHQWDATPGSLISSYIKYGKCECPICTNKRIITGINDLATTNPNLLLEWDYKNNMLDPTKISAGTPKKASWICKKCGNRWTMRINLRTRHINPEGCPECGKEKCKESWAKTILKRTGSLADNYPDLLYEWNYSKNTVDPHLITPGYTKKVWWTCKKCAYEYLASPLSRTSKKTGCPVCNKGKLWKGHNDLATTHPEIAKLWHPTKNGNLTPKDVKASSSRSVWWKCDKCGHEWKTGIYNLTRNDSKKSKCPECSRIEYKVKSGVNDLETFCKSAGLDYVLDEWDYANNQVLGLTPKTTHYKTGRNVWWNCRECKKSYYMIPIIKIEDYELRGKIACPHCKNLSSNTSHFV